jgi:hypothetical protein
VVAVAGTLHDAHALFDGERLQVGEGELAWVRDTGDVEAIAVRIDFRMTVAIIRNATGCSQRPSQRAMPSTGRSSSSSGAAFSSCVATGTSEASWTRESGTAGTT